MESNLNESSSSQYSVKKFNDQTQQADIRFDQQRAIHGHEAKSKQEWVKPTRGDGEAGGCRRVRVNREKRKRQKADEAAEQKQQHEVRTGGFDDWTLLGENEKMNDKHTRYDTMIP
jgi:hypothetical protein